MSDELIGWIVYLLFLAITVGLGLATWLSVKDTFYQPDDQDYSDVDALARKHRREEEK